MRASCTSRVSLPLTVLVTAALAACSGVEEGTGGHEGHHPEPA